MARNDTIQLIIAAKNEASKVLQQVSKDLNKIQSPTSGGGAMNSMVSNATIAATGAFAVSLGVVANTAAQTAAQYERLKYSTDALGAQYNLTSSDIISAVDKISQGTLSNSTILEQANKAMLLGVANSKDEFETLTKIAIDRGRAMGVSMEHAFNSIVLGVGRLSPLILDNLGIILDADTTYGNFAKTIGKTADALSDAEKRQALLGKLKDEMGDFDSSNVLDAASAWERVGAEFSNLTIGIGQFLNESGAVINVLNGIADTLDRINSIAFPQSTNEQVKGFEYQIEANKKILAEYEAELQRLNNLEGIEGFLQDFNGNTSAGLEEAIARIREEIRQLNYEMYLAGSNEGKSNGLKESFVNAEASAAALALATMETNRQQEQVNTAVKDYANLMGVSKAEAEWLFSVMQKLYGSVDQAAAAMSQFNARLSEAQALAASVANAMGGAYSALESAAVAAYKNTGFSQEVLGVYQSQLATLKNVEQSLVNQGVSAEMLPFAIAEATDGATGFFDTINQAANATERVGGGAKQITQEFTSLKGIVEGIFSGLFDDIGGVDPEDFLPREDAPNEAARRIADVMIRGFESPWAEYFKSSFPDLFSEYMGASGGDVKVAAARLLKDFQDGMRPELIDTNAIKEIAKRMFQADQSTSAMIDQVARELAAEMGISIEKATGYASGAAGKKVIDPALIDEAKKSMVFAPTFDFSGAKSGLIEAGKSAGIFSDTGNILIPATVSIDAVALSAESLPTVELLVTRFLLGSTKEEITSKIANDLGDVQVFAMFNFSKSVSDFSTFAQQISENIGNVNINTFFATPTPEVLEAWKLNVSGLVGSIGVPIQPVLSANILESITAINNVISEGVAGEAQGILLAENLTNNFGAGIEEQYTQIAIYGILFGSYVFQGFSEYNIGTMLAFELGRQVGEAQTSFEASGKYAGGKWGDAFLGVVGENVPIRLVEILTDLITPEVMKALSEQGSRK